MGWPGEDHLPIDYLQCLQANWKGFGNCSAMAGAAKDTTRATAITSFFISVSPLFR